MSKRQTGVRRREASLKSQPAMTTRAQIRRQKLSVNDTDEEAEKQLVADFVVVEDAKEADLQGETDWKLERDLDDEAELKRHKNQFIGLLFFLYFLQGLPLGLTGAIPFLMSSSKISYSDQGTFSFAFWPFSIKLLWAPIVDSIYSKRMGRRKSWVVPIQALTGFYLIWFAERVKGYLEMENQSHSIIKLTGVFFFFTFLSATQDIAVDGWGLNMFVKKDISWTATCESVGKTLGWFIGNVIFLVLESPRFSNDYIRPFFGFEPQENGIVTLDQFMIYFGVVYLVSTLYLVIFVGEFRHVRLKSKRERSASIADKLDVFSTYRFIWSICQIKPMRCLVFILLTFRIGFLVKSASYFKLMEAGVSKEKLGLLALPLTPIEILMPVMVNWMIADQSANPFRYFTRSYLMKLLVTVFVSYWVFVTPAFQDSETGEYPFHYYMLSLGVQVVNSFVNYALFVPFSWFFARISDNTIGGTYLTFLNTMFNLGSSWMTTASLYLMELLDFKYCKYRDLANANATLLDSACLSASQKEKCAQSGGVCETWIDPFYLQSCFCFFAGLLWIALFRNSLTKLASTPDSAWKLFKTGRAKAN